MKRFNYSLYCIVGTFALTGLGILSGCNGAEDLYNPDRVQEEAKKNFPVKDIDPNHTWETSTLCQASISVNEKAGESYTLKIYTDNPYNKHGHAALLATTQATDGATARFTFDLPVALKYVYVMKVNSRGYSSVIPAKVENGIVKATFGKAGTRAEEKHGIIETPEITSPDFPKSKPTDLQTWPKETWSGFKAGGNYEVPASYSGNISAANGANYYVTKDAKLVESNYATFSIQSGDANLYVMDGATLTIEHNYLEDFAPSINSGKISIYVCRGGKLNIKETSKLHIGKNVCLYIEKDGTLTAKELFFDNNGEFKNYGTVEISGSFTSNNSTNTDIYNMGTLTAGEFKLEGGAKFFNQLGTVTINGKSTVGCTNGVWRNDGTFHSGSMEFLSTSNSWYNHCRLEVDQDLDFKLGSGGNNWFILDAESYIGCENLHMSQAKIEMGYNSQIKVRNIAKFDANSNNEINCRGEKYSVIDMEKAESNGNAYKCITYSGNLYVACNDHFNDAQPGSDVYTLGDGVIFAGKNGADIDIEAAECHDAYPSKPDGGDTANDQPLAYAYGFEDLDRDGGNCDYDFNDVVLYVTVPYDKAGKRVIDVTLKAAGASKKLAVYLEGKEIFANVHEALGVPTGMLTNTGEATGTPKTVTVEVADDFNLTQHGDFYITDDKSRNVHIPAFTAGFKAGNVPYAIRVPQTNWAWPKERISIEQAYPAFTDWAKNALQDGDWYSAPDKESVMTF